MTVTEIREKVIEHFSKPDAVMGYVKNPDAETAEEIDGKCVYRGDGDPASPVRCAFGCLIPDEIYNPNWDLNGGKISAYLFSHSDALQDLFSSEDQGEIRNLQSLHDSMANSGHSPAEFVEEVKLLS